jgi:hypothetical protein
MSWYISPQIPHSDNPRSIRGDVNKNGFAATG